MGPGPQSPQQPQAEGAGSVDPFAEDAGADFERAFAEEGDVLPADGQDPGPFGSGADLLGAALVPDLERQRDEYLDSLRRLQAEFDNYRKRIERQHRDVVDNAASGLVKKLLPVLDTADLALAHGGGEDIKQLAGALLDVLSREGLERIVPEGQPFDPEHHDAVAHEPAEGGATPAQPEVSEVLRAGYLWKGRALRPAMVKVRG